MDINMLDICQLLKYLNLQLYLGMLISMKYLKDNNFEHKLYIEKSWNNIDMENCKVYKN